MFKAKTPVKWLQCLMPKSDQFQRESNLLFGKTPKISSIPDPDEIIWENLAFTGDEQNARRIAINVFSVFFLLLNTLFTMYLAGIEGLMNREIPEAVGCPEVEISKLSAY